MPTGMMPAGGLPPGWQLAVDAMGRPFYYNYFTQQTSWTPPSATNVPSIPPAAMYSVPAPPASIPVAPPVSAPAVTPPSTSPAVDSMLLPSYTLSRLLYLRFFILRRTTSRLGGGN